MYSFRSPILLATLILLLHPALLSSIRAEEGAPKLGFQVPEGFEVALYADDSLATDIHSLTIDAHGRVVVASKGYIKILHDTKGVGKADKATLFADFPKSGAHGMYFDGDDLICNGDKGVRRLYDTKGEGKCDKVSEIWLPTKNDGEHSANGIVRGPDGWYYMVSGNDAGITKAHASGPRSPVKEPGAGAIVRFTEGGKTQEVVAHGFRNPYDLAFNHLGNLFTVDSDGERVYHMPYYAPTRLFDVATGMHHGWLGAGWKGSWSRPDCWPDNVERMVEIGRGSPTGLVVYRHRQFPERYRNGVFSLCWTFGRLYFFPLERDGSTYKSKMEVFMKTTGDVGFAPTDMAVGPDGDLFIAIGGRGTRGGVFKVSYKGKHAPDDKKRASRVSGGSTPGTIEAVLNADEPLSSWSRTRWVPDAKKLGKDAFGVAVMDDGLNLEQRIRAVEILTELFGGAPLDLAERLCLDKKTDPEVIARIVWSLSRSSEKAAWAIITKMTHKSDSRIERAAWEALQSIPSTLQISGADWRGGLDSQRRVRAATIAVAKGQGQKSFLKEFLEAARPWERDTLAQQWVWLSTWPILRPKTDKLSVYFQNCVDILAFKHEVELGDKVEFVKVPVPLRMEAVRLLQLALGDVAVEDGPATKPFWGYEARNVGKFDVGLRRETAKKLTKLFPTGDTQLDQELARLLGMLGEDIPGLPALIASCWTKDSKVGDDIHYLLIFARLPGKRDMDVTTKTAAALNGIHLKLAAQGAKPADQVPGILEALLEQLIEFDPNLPAALVNDPAFGNPGHALWAGKLPLEQKRIATRKLLARIGTLNEEDAQLAWTPDMVRLVGTLPDDESLPLLRARFADPRLSDTALLLLAKKRQAEDRSRFVEALGSLQPAVVAAAAEALVKLPSGKDKNAKELGKAVRALRRLEGQKGDAKASPALVSLLVHWSGQETKASKEGLAAAWGNWFAKTYPDEAVLNAAPGTDFKAWKKRLDAVNWDKGDVRRGEIVFQRRSCFACHGSSRRLGPDLTGIAQRFSRDDLFTAIIDPSKDIAPSYVATMIATTTGKVYNGMMVYESTQLYLLQTSPDTTVRIPGEEVQTVQPSLTSFMPVGLLDDATETDLADLYAYLTSLRKK